MKKKRVWIFFQMPALPFRAKAGRNSAGMGLILVKMPVHFFAQAKGCAKGTETCGLLTNSPAFSPLFPFSMFYTARSTVRIRDWEPTWKALWCWKVSYICSDLTTGIFVPKKKLLLQSRFTDSSSSCKFSHLFHLWISKHTEMERLWVRISHKCPWEWWRSATITVTSS